MDSRDTELLKIIGKNIKAQRKKSKFGQDELSKMISLSRSSLSNIEIGKHQPSIRSIYEIALSLNCEISDLLPTVKNYQDVSPLIEDEDKFKGYYDSLPENMSKNNLDIIKEILRKDDK